MNNAQRLAEVRRRVIVDFYDGTGQSAGHWITFCLCGWAWRYGEKELHDLGCPMEG